MIDLHKSSYKYIIFLITFALTLWINIRAIPTTSMEYDESHWIHTSTYYEVLLTQPANSSYWDEIYWTLTQPPMARYVIGFSRSLFGIDSTQLNKPWDFDLTYEENVANNNMPSKQLLYISRLPMAILSSFTATMIFILLFEGAGLIASVAFLFLYGMNGLLIADLVRAMGDPPFIFFITLSAFICFFAIREYQLALENHGHRKYTKSYILFFLSAFMCGLGGSSKINGLLACSGILLVVFIQTVFFTKHLTDQIKFSLIVRFSFLIIMASLFAFIVVNPYLYPNPFERIGRMYKFRFGEMAIQIQRYPESHVSGFTKRVNLLFKEILPSFYPIRNLFFSILNLVLIILGCRSIFDAYIMGQNNHSQKFGPYVFVLIFLPLALAAFLTPLNWERYLLPCVFFNLVSISVAINWLVSMLINNGQKTAQKRAQE